MENSIQSHTANYGEGSTQNVLQDLLKIYYRRLFPHNKICQWLAYGTTESNVFTNREISFTLENDVYIRFQSFENETDFEKEICNKLPIKIDIGPVYNVRPKDRLSVAKIDPVQREFVIDIDMTDYDSVRTCCRDATVCSKCWKFLDVACQCIDVALREDFGFQHILWVFSGRRGIHCWVCDKVSRHLDNRGRSAVIDYLNILVGATDSGLSRVNVGVKMHHSVKRSYKIIKPMFEEIIIQDQDLFGNEDGRKKLLSLIPDEKMRNELANTLKDYIKTLDSQAVWNIFLDLVNNESYKKHRFLVEEVQLAFLYPRLDVNVSKGMNHLLKAPFCVHPKTGKVCVPFNATTASRFSPLTAPNINELLKELDEYDKINNVGNIQDHQSKIKEYKKTSMFKGMVVFDEFLKKLEVSHKSEVCAKNGNLEF